MTDLVDFLRARLDAEEAVIRRADPSADPQDTDAAFGIAALRIETGDQVVDVLAIGKRRALAEVEAKRRIIERLEALVATLNAAGQTMPSRESGELVEGILLDLALPYADHHDYDPGWRPSAVA